MTEDPSQQRFNELVAWTLRSIANDLDSLLNGDDPHTTNNWLTDATDELVRVAGHLSAETPPQCVPIPCEAPVNVTSLDGEILPMKGKETTHDT